MVTNEESTTLRRTGQLAGQVIDSLNNQAAARAQWSKATLDRASGQEIFRASQKRRDAEQATSRLTEDYIALVAGEIAKQL